MDPCHCMEKGSYVKYVEAERNPLYRKVGRQRKQFARTPTVPEMVIACNQLTQEKP
jgi:hypothetical protein